MIDERLLSLLINNAQKHVNPINQALLASDELKRLSDKELAVAIVLYAAGLANLTDLKAEDFVALSIYAYNNVEIVHPQERTGNA